MDGVQPLLHGLALAALERRLLPLSLLVIPLEGGRLLSKLLVGAILLDLRLEAILQLRAHNRRARRMRRRWQAVRRSEEESAVVRGEAAGSTGLSQQYTWTWIRALRCGCPALRSREPTGAG